MLKTISDIIHKAIKDAPFKVVINKDQFQVINKTGSNGAIIVFQSSLHDQAEDMMDAFNDAWIARKTIEGMRELQLPFNTVYDRNSWRKICEGILNENDR